MRANNKYKILYATLLVALCGCTNIPYVDEHNGAIQFAVDVRDMVATRASLDDINITSIGLYAASTNRTDNIFTNKELEHDNASSTWGYSGNKIFYEEAEAINFFAYSPYDSTKSNVVVDPTTKTISMSYALTGGKAEDDLILAGVSSSENDVPLTFSHALSAIGFKLAGMCSYKISDLEISGICDSGTVSFDATGNVVWSNLSVTDTDSATDGIQPQSYSVTIDDATPDGSTKPIIGSDGYLMMLPQLIPSGAILKITLTSIFAEEVSEIVKYIQISGELKAGNSHNIVINLDDLEYIKIDLTSDQNDFKTAVNSANQATHQSFTLQGSMCRSLMDFRLTHLSDNSGQTQYITSVDISDLVLYDDDKATQNNTILAGAFDGTSVTTLFATNITSITSETFGTTANIKSLTLGVSEIESGGEALDNLKGNLRELYLPTISTINSYSLNWDFNKLETVYAPLATTIEEGAFKYANLSASDDSRTSLIKDIYFPKVTTVGSQAFTGCTALTSLNFSMAEELGEYVFYKCTNVKDVTMPELTSVGKGAFESCTNLTTLNLPSLITVGDYAFNDCPSLRYVRLPSAQTIGTYAFLETSLVEINLSVATQIGKNAFFELTDFIEIEAPEAEIIGSEAFRGCTSLTKVSLPEAKHISWRAFEDCVNLDTVDIPNVCCIGDATDNGGDMNSDNVFVNTKVQNLTIGIDVLPKTYSYYKSEGRTTQIDCLAELQKIAATLTELNLPELSTVNGKAFDGLDNLTKLTLPSVISLTTGNPFTGLSTNIKELSMPSLTRSCTFALGSLDTIEKLYLSGLYTFENGAFKNISPDLKELHLTGSVRFAFSSEDVTTYFDSSTAMINCDLYVHYSNSAFCDKEGDCYYFRINTKGYTDGTEQTEQFKAIYINSAANPDEYTLIN